MRIYLWKFFGSRGNDVLRFDPQKAFASRGDNKKLPLISDLDIPDKKKGMPGNGDRSFFLLTWCRIAAPLARKQKSFRRCDTEAKRVFFFCGNKKSWNFFFDLLNLVVIDKMKQKCFHNLCNVIFYGFNPL